ncbi:ribokinase [Rhizobium sp. LC145]|uniref:ribokinase n=1 Tax=Rhizobium sp. LC145 TaxID=1120688 RepID=UPI00062A4846|nr:ribokinase [Rhizobium sp. LC145]KKX27097.1 ribose-phosphate pyrophosphokinase [Rhizobium sp. LC145]TKT56585.1 ribokinase [Rhizobiaceae bacterium LC148]
MIVTFGSLNVDLVFSLEAMPQPGQTLLAKCLRTEAGGKGANQALAAARDGAEVVFVGAIGRDPLAEIAIANLATVADVKRVSRVSEPTGCASIFIDAQGRNLIAVAAGANLAASAGSVDDDLLHRANIVLMQMENNIGETERLIRRVRDAGKMSILNLAPATELEFDLLSLCDLIIVNDDEAVALAGWFGCEPSAEGIAHRLNTGVLRTLGEDGAEAVFKGEFVRVPAVKVDVKDTTAAGDCFVGVLAACLDRGRTLKEAMQRAVIAAGIACLRAGSQSSIPTRTETDSFTSSQ